MNTGQYITQDYGQDDEIRLRGVNKQIILYSGSTSAVTMNTERKSVSATELTSSRAIIGTRDLGFSNQTTVGTNAQGDVIYWEADIDTTPGKIYYLQANNNLTLADKDAGVSSTGSLVVALAANAQQGVLLRGLVKMADNTGASGPGMPIYLSDNGTTSYEAPGTGDFVRVVGYSMSGSAGLYFNPDNTWVKVT